MKRFHITAPFATPEQVGKILGVSPRRVKEIKELAAKLLKPKRSKPRH